MRRSGGCWPPSTSSASATNTIVVLVSDNGASGEAGPHGSVSEFRFAQGRDEDLDLNLRLIDELGGQRTYNHYPWGWAEAGNTPVRRFKRYTFEGGVRDPFIISWPGGPGRRRRDPAPVLPRDRRAPDAARPARHRRPRSGSAASSR